MNWKHKFAVLTAVIGVCIGGFLMGVGAATVVKHLYPSGGDVSTLASLGCEHFEIAQGVYFEKCLLPDGVTCYVHIPPFGITGIAMWCER